MEFNGKQVRTRAEWTGAFTEQFVKGDYVDSEIVWDFAECVPPKRMSAALVQCGEPYDSKQDSEGKMRMTYITFKNLQGGLDDGSVWEYCGLCFAGQTEES